MADLVYLGLVVVVFAALVGLVRLCDAVVRGERTTTVPVTSAPGAAAEVEGVAP